MVAANAAAHKIDALIAIDASTARSMALSLSHEAHKYIALLSVQSFTEIRGRCKEGLIEKLNLACNRDWKV